MCVFISLPHLTNLLNPAFHQPRIYSNPLVKFLHSPEIGDSFSGHTVDKVFAAKETLETFYSNLRGESIDRDKRIQDLEAKMEGMGLTEEEKEERRAELKVFLRVGVGLGLWLG